MIVIWVDKADWNIWCTFSKNVIRWKTYPLRENNGILMSLLLAFLRLYCEL